MEKYDLYMKNFGIQKQRAKNNCNKCYQFLSVCTTQLKHMLLYLMTVVFLITSSGCISKDTLNETEQRIVIGIPRESGSLDPAGTIANTYLTVSAVTTDELITFDENGEVEYRGAIAYEKNEDATQWIIHLRPESKWSNGEPVTAYDYINTMQRALDPNNGSGYADYLFFIKNAKEIYEGSLEMNELGINTPDEYTLVFELKEPCVYFLELLRLPVYHPSYSGNQMVDDSRLNEMVSNGPFYIEKHKKNQEIVLGKNPYYWDQEEILLENIIFRIIGDEQALAFAYETGEIDIAPNLGPNIMEQYQGQADLMVSPMVATRFIYPNLRIPVLQDVRVREALALAIDREALCQMIGQNTMPTTHLVATQIKEAGTDRYFVETDALMFQEDVERAKELLAQAGYPEGKNFPVLIYNYPTIELDLDVAQVLQAQWKQNLGITVQLNPQELQTHYAQRRSGDFELSRMHWTADFLDPYTYLALLMSDGTYNCSAIDDQRYDALLDESNREMNIERRNNLLHEAERIAVSEEFYVIPLFSLNNVNLVNPKITGIKRIAASGLLDYRYADIKKQP